MESKLETTPPAGATEVVTPNTLELALAALEANKAELAKLTGKYDRARDDLGKFRTRSEEVEAAHQATQDALKAKEPLEARLKALEQQLADQVKTGRERDEQLSLDAIRTELASSGVTANRLDDALSLYAIARTKVVEGEEPLTVPAFLTARPYLTGSGTPVIPQVLPTGPGVTSNKLAPKTVEEIKLEKIRKGAYQPL